MARKLMNTRVLFGLAMAVLGVWMVLLAQWALAVTERAICYIWWTTTGIGGLAVVGGLVLMLGTLTVVWQFRHSQR